MTKQKKFKARVRKRATKTGESYAAARKRLDDRRRLDEAPRPSAAFLAAHENLSLVTPLHLSGRRYDGPGIGGKADGVDLDSYSEGAVIAGSVNQHATRRIQAQAQVHTDRLHNALDAMATRDPVLVTAMRLLVETHPDVVKATLRERNAIPQPAHHAQTRKVLKEYEDEVAAHGVIWGPHVPYVPTTTHKTSRALFQTLKKIQSNGTTTLAFGDPKTRSLGFVDETDGMAHCVNIAAFRDTPKEDEEAIAKVMGKPYKEIRESLRTPEGRLGLFSNSPLAKYYSHLSEEEKEHQRKLLEELLGTSNHEELLGTSNHEINLLASLWTAVPEATFWPLDEDWLTLNG